MVNKKVDDDFHRLISQESLIKSHACMAIDNQ